MDKESNQTLIELRDELEKHKKVLEILKKESDEKKKDLTLLKKQLKVTKRECRIRTNKNCLSKMLRFIK